MANPLYSILIMMALSSWCAAQNPSASAGRTKEPGREPPQMTVALELDSLEIREGEPLPVRCLVDVMDPKLVDPDYSADCELCVQYFGHFLSAGEEDPGIAGSVEPSGLADLLNTNDKKSWTLRYFTEPAKVLGPRYVGLQTNGLGSQNSLASAPLYPPPGCGRYFVRVLAGWKHKEDAFPKYRAYDHTVINIVPAEKKLSILEFDVEGGTTIRAGEQFSVVLRFELQGAEYGPGKKTEIPGKCVLRQTKTTSGKTATAIEKAGVWRVPVPSAGSITAERRWTGKCGNPGEYELLVDMNAPGFPAVRRSLVLRVTDAEVKGNLRTSEPAKPGRKWVRDAQPRYKYDDANHDAPPSSSGPGWSVSYGPNSMTVTEQIDVNGQKQTVQNTVQWATPPETIYENETFDMTLRSSRNKEGAGALVSLHCSGDDWEMTASSPACENWSASWRDEPASCYTKMTKTLKMARNPYEPIALWVSAGPWMSVRNPDIKHCLVVWNYTEVDTTTQDASATETTGGLFLEPAEASAPLEAWLEPGTVETTPRSGLYSCADLRIRGVKPNGNPVEVEFDTTDARGTLAMNRYIKVEGRGSRETGDMWNDNMGSFRWSLNVGANLGVNYGLYRLPITVRQRDHGEVKLALDIRVLPRGDASSPAAPSATPPSPPINRPTPVAPPAADLAKAQALFDQGDMQGAAEAFDLVVRHNPDGIPGRTGRMYAQFWLQQFSGAADDCRAIIRLNPANDEMRRLLVLLLLLNGQPDPAELALDQLEMRDPDQAESDPAFLILKGQVQVAQGMGGQAQSTFQRVMELDPQRPARLYADVPVLLQKGMFGMVALFCDTIMRLDPDSEWADQARQCLSL